MVSRAQERRQVALQMQQSSAQKDTIAMRHHNVNGIEAYILRMEATSAEDYLKLGLPPVGCITSLDIIAFTEAKATVDTWREGQWERRLTAGLLKFTNKQYRIYHCLRQFSKRCGVVVAIAEDFLDKWEW